MQVTTGASIFGYQPAKAGASRGASKPSATDEGGSREQEDGGLGGSSVEQDFLKYAKMIPLDRMRAGILKSMNLIEADLAKMTPDQRVAAPAQKIREAIEQRLEKRGQPSGSLVDQSA
ncbi:hypothetical protein EDE08_12820 [Bradyrhizobium sp. R2.2-H]|jgi:hypothetical protein|uniref:hypothetical protein n=1 Tax=unclassified Bradyrhizobium TaxID=2631580 RepID=UPI00104A877F|nr:MULTISPECIES: hypothetical protein [unclassified Bradyrhizobium]TCU59301.1 hypothetical protein EDE10_12826 [Bradyrhizobium sp. Y-H1]TCU63691.1 hypothetical protein EDE08_12820 [Bradyrhizobium sp. R2.2-H]